MEVVLDRLFGTRAAAQPGARMRYGLVHPMGSNNPLTLALGEARPRCRDGHRVRALAHTLNSHNDDNLTLCL